MGSAAVSSNTGRGKVGVEPPDRKLRAGIGTVCRDADSTGLHFLFLTCGTSPVFSILKQDPGRAGPIPLEVIYARAGIVLSSLLFRSPAAELV